jgi:hypothetical protein
VTLVVINIVCGVLVVAGLITFAIRRRMGTRASKTFTRGLLLAIILVALIGIINSIVFFVNL